MIKPPRGPAVWRALILVSCVLSAFVLWSSTQLYKKNAENITANASLACHIGSFFVGEPIAQPPDVDDQHFIKSLNKSSALLRSIKYVDCSAVIGATLTEEQVNDTLKRIHAVRAKVEAGL